MKNVALALLLALVLVPFAGARKSGSSGSSQPAARSRSKVKSKVKKPKKASKRRRASPAARCAFCARDKKDRIARSQAARREFQKSNPCPSTGKTSGACRGYVIDHVTPLKRGGADAPGNMQWQTQAAAKAKDKVE